MNECSQHCKLENFEITQRVEVKGILLFWATVDSYHLVYRAAGVLQRYAVIYLYGDSQKIAVFGKHPKIHLSRSQTLLLFDGFILYSYLLYLMSVVLLSLLYLTIIISYFYSHYILDITQYVFIVFYLVICCCSFLNHLMILEMEFKA